MVKRIAEVCGDKPVTAVTEADYVAITASFSHLSQATRHGYSNCLRWFAEYIHTCGGPDIASTVPKYKPGRARTVIPTEDEMAALMLHATPAMRLFLLLCSQCGLRIGDAVAVGPNNVHNGRLHAVGKLGNLTNIPIPRAVAAMLETIPPGGDPAIPFVARLSKEWRSPVQAYQRQFLRLRRRAGVREELRVHDLRRLAARKVYEATGDLRCVQALLGHTAMGSTFSYLRANNPELKAEELERAIALTVVRP